MAESEASADLRYRVRRNASGIAGWFRENWQSNRRFRLAGYALGCLVLLYALLWLLLLRGLPSADKLLDYPKPLINAYLAAEDKTFWTHSGVDYTGLAGAVIDYISKIGSDARAKGGSTITQQVAKNILIGNEYSLGRKFKEMILAGRIEGVLNKQQILELYLNEIALGRRPGGIARLFREGREPAAAARSGLSRDPSQGTGNLWPCQACRDRAGAAQLGAGPDGQERLGN
jgi:penicillin-binding protein 1A